MLNSASPLGPDADATGSAASRRAWRATLDAVCLAVSVVLALTTGDARALIARGGVTYLVLAAAAAVSVTSLREPVIAVSAPVGAGQEATSSRTW